MDHGGIIIPAGVDEMLIPEILLRQYLPQLWRLDEGSSSWRNGINYRLGSYNIFGTRNGNRKTTS
jgi:hypothetical protein